MKILQLRFKNINSLSGQFEIDFTNPQYISEGLFLISGPTGTGKSSILDAICIALYGKTPRISSISASTNEVMSLGTSDCFAEVVFEVGSTQYRSVFNQSRNRKGDLTAPKYRLENLTQSKVLCQQKRDWDNQINSITGMDFDRFVQSVLLAQGEFKKFLEANPTDRAILLEKITGGEIYTLISMAVFERHKEEGEKLKALKNEASLIKTMTSDEISECKKKIKECIEKKKTVDKKEQELRSAAVWLNACSTAEKELKQLFENLAIIKKENDEFTQDRLLLEKAVVAESFEKDYIKIEGREHLLQDTLKKLSVVITDLKSLRGEYDSNTSRLQEAVAATEASRESVEALKKLIPRIRELDSDLKIVGKNLAEKESVLINLQKKLSVLNQLLQENFNEIAQHNSNLAAIHEYQQSHESDSRLGSELSLISSKADEARKLKKQIRELNQELSNKLSDIHELQKKNPEDKAQESECQQIIDNAEAQLMQQDEGGLPEGNLAGLLSRKDTLQGMIQAAEKGIALCSELETLHSDIRKLESDHAGLKENNNLLVADIDAAEKLIECQKAELKLLKEKVKYIEIRAALEPGVECPVCGSAHHPYIVENKETGAGDLRKVIELEDGIQELNSSVQEKRIEKAGCDIEIVNRNKEIVRMGNRVQELNQALTLIKEQLSQQESDTIPENFTRLHKEYIQELTTISESIKLVQTYQVLRAQAQNAKIALAEYRQKLSDYSSMISQVQSRSTQLQIDITGREKELEAIISSVVELGVQFNFDHESVIDNESTMNVLRERVTTWAAKSNEQNELKQVLVQCQQSRETHENQANELKRQIIETEQELQTIRETNSRLSEKRNELFGDKNPETERDLLELELEKKSKTVQQLQNELSKLNGTIIEKAVQEEMLQAESTELDLMIKTLITEFEEAIQKEGIKDISNFRTLRLPERELLALQEKAKALDSRLSIAEEKVKSKQEDFEKLKALKLTDQTISDVEKSLQTLREESDAIVTTISLEEQRLTEDEKNCALVEENLKLADAQSAQLQKWARLNELIGQASGDKFRKIAQGMIFDRLLVYANKNLHQIMKRYELKKSGAEGLEISVIDYDNAGSVRPVKNLSGGESFIVSLALALGLSNMASSRIRIDSLFLDEGFGTLDDDVLETALTTLSDLRAGGKLVGIISHIDKIKDRIPLKLEVRRIREGVSIISGPGVTVV